MANRKVMASSINVLSMGATTAGKSSTINVSWCERSFGGTNIAGLFYQYFLIENQSCFRNSDETIIKNAMQYVTSTKVKADMNKALRDRIFRYRMPNSIIVNEVLGLYKITKCAIDYIKYTVKMHLDT